MVNVEIVMVKQTVNNQYKNPVIRSRLFFFKQTISQRVGLKSRDKRLPGHQALKKREYIFLMSVSEHLSRPVLRSVENRDEVMRDGIVYAKHSQRKKIRARVIAGTIRWQSFRSLHYGIFVVSHLIPLQA